MRPTKNVVKKIARFMVVCKALVVVLLAVELFIANAMVGPSLMSVRNEAKYVFSLGKSDILLLNSRGRGRGIYHVCFSILFPNKLQWK